jgi:hypothetical protein
VKFVLGLSAPIRDSTAMRMYRNRGQALKNMDRQSVIIVQRDSRHRGPARWKGTQPSRGIVEVDPILAPVVAIRNQLELLASQRMVWMDDFKDGIAMVVMRCS